MTATEFSSFYEAHANRLTAFLTVKFRDEELAQEAVQQAALYLCERLHKYTTPTPSYFRQLACNRALDMVRTDPRHASARRLHETNVGTWFDLARVDDHLTLYDGENPDSSRCVSEGDEK